MRILGIDTATSVASAALVEDGRVIAEQNYGARKVRQTPNLKSNHAEVILPLIEAVLQQAGSSLDALSALAVSIGPGSFTGLRIGLSTIKGLAYGSDLPVIGVLTLLANAARVENFQGLICSFLDARKKEVYAALFRQGSEGLTRLSEDRAAGALEIVELASSTARAGESCLFIGDGAVSYEKSVRDVFGPKAILTAGEEYPSLAAAVARLSAQRLHEHNGNHASALTPVYLRPAEAQLKLLNSAAARQEALDYIDKNTLVR